jgi:hypothetical protein
MTMGPIVTKQNPAMPRAKAIDAQMLTVKTVKVKEAVCDVPFSTVPKLDSV